MDKYQLQQHCLDVWLKYPTDILLSMRWGAQGRICVKSWLYYGCTLALRHHKLLSWR